jgi:hypothetical protein
MLGRVAVLGVAIFLIPAVSSPAVQDGHNPDWRKCTKCTNALSKAMSFVKSKYKGSGLAGHVYGGFAFLMDDSGSSGSDLQDCVRWCSGAIKQKGFNGNWYLGMCMFFLAEYSMKFGTGETGGALSEGIKVAAENVEETGGWCHSKGMWEKTGYNKKGGGRDLGIVTSMIYGAFLEMKSMGIDPGSMAEKAMKNLESISDGSGVCYGTDNRVPDFGNSRASYALLGMQATKRTDHPLYSKYSDGVSKKYKGTPQGHAFGPLHYFGVAAAMHRMGPGEYQKFTAEFLDKLISAQAADGSVPMQSDGGKRKDADQFMDSVASTAVFACIIMMQKDGVFNPKAKAKPAAGGSKPPGGPSPFAFKNKDKPANVPTGSAPTAKKDDEGGMPKPYIPEEFKDSAQPDPEGFGGGMKAEDYENPK